MQDLLNFKLTPVTSLSISEMSPEPETLMLQTVELEEISFKYVLILLITATELVIVYMTLSVNTAKRELFLLLAVTAKVQTRNLTKRPLV